MNNISIAPEIRKKCPDLVLGCFSCQLTWEASSKGLEKKIQDTCASLAQELTRPEVSQIEAIASSRAAYKALGKDPSRYRLSAEALLRRVVSGKGLYQINTIVDTLNLISIKTGYSIGGYDAAKIEGDIVLGIGAKGELYEGIGKGDLNIEHLPVFRDNKGAFGTPTSDSTRTMVTENTSSFLMVFLNFGNHATLKDSLIQTKSLYEEYTNATDCQTLIIE
ncbi:phenylalanine--tRNA ligase beta subunit-related protein [Aureispira sp. CCB-E]|uniref:B3/B4 domain-containing protein n=1 Tax=Aureispira sp. CCB-E TaxID=3051121 RepID=UPI002868C616|nr:phenylalanine--tRNA ligase beta subunit-related protein [Aureispira sp. CCB-E]WMX12447.1 phenylalanine--tRNA ligase beta subunit-related protein [Aureispira sp. CCB-E]